MIHPPQSRGLPCEGLYEACYVFGFLCAAVCLTDSVELHIPWGGSTYHTPAALSPGCREFGIYLWRVTF